MTESGRAGARKPLQQGGQWLGLDLLSSGGAKEALSVLCLTYPELVPWSIATFLQRTGPMQCSGAGIPVHSLRLGSRTKLPLVWDLSHLFQVQTSFMEEERAALGFEFRI